MVEIKFFPNINYGHTTHTHWPSGFLDRMDSERRARLERIEGYCAGHSEHQRLMPVEIHSVSVATSHNYDEFIKCTLIKLLYSHAGNILAGTVVVGEMRGVVERRRFTQNSILIKSFKKDTI